MEYQGPPCFEQMLVSAHQRVMHHLTRSDSPKVRIGATNPDTERVIAEYVENVQRQENETDITYAGEDLLQICARIEATSENPGYYDAGKDEIVLSSTACAFFYSAAICYNMRTIDISPAEEFAKELARLFLKWDFGDSFANRRIQLYAKHSRNHPDYDETMNSVLNTLGQLGIPQFQEMISILGKTIICLPKGEATVACCDNGIHFLEIGVTQGIRAMMCKAKHYTNQSYRTGKNVFEI